MAEVFLLNSRCFHHEITANAPRDQIKRVLISLAWAKLSRPECRENSNYVAKMSNNVAFLDKMAAIGEWVEQAVRGRQKSV